ncbi:MAG: histidine phosphatase family protein [Xanthomonadales bacterium]|nr:histidine phosphatase family protein [Xanthomonadales bacterium]
MQRLILIRHAQAGSSPSGADLDRPLSELGRAQAEVQGRWLQGRELGIDRVLCSNAARTIETARAVGLSKPLELPAIYTATAGELVRILESHIDASVVCLVGHNPGISGLAGFLTGQRLPMAPGQVIGIHFEPPLVSSVQPGTGQVFAFRPPPPVDEGGS